MVGRESWEDKNDSSLRHEAEEEEVGRRSSQDRKRCKRKLADPAARGSYARLRRTQILVRSLVARGGRSDGESGLTGRRPNPECPARDAVAVAWIFDPAN